MNAPRYSYQAINTLALSDTGHFVFLNAWTISLLGSMLSQNMPLWFWTNNQFPLTPVEIDDLEAKLAAAGGQLMQSIVGLIMPIVTSEIPQGTLLCDGTIYLKSDYPNLYDALDSVFIIDASSFTVPDLTDRFIMGTSVGANVGTTGGNSEISQTIAQLAPHSHTSPPHSHTESAAGPTAILVGVGAPVPSALPAASVTGATSVSIDSTGSGEPMNITPPYIALRYVVVAL
jgi:microcystin-dependent protein